MAGIVGALDFGVGMVKTVATGWAELIDITGGVDVGKSSLGVFSNREPSVIKEIYESPSIIWDTGLNIGKDILETINPIEECETLLDPHMSPEGKAWAVSCIALKIANALLMRESAKDLKGAPETKCKSLKESLGRAPKKPTPIAPKPVKSPQPGSRVSKMTPKEAVAQAEKMVPREKAAAFKKYKQGVAETLDDFAQKVKNGEPITSKDVLEVTKDPTSTRQVLGKTKKPVPSEVTEAVKKGRRAIYGETDEAVAAELQKNPKYAEGKIRAKEVSTGGAADAAGSTDRDVMYVHEKQVIGRNGKIRVLEEPIPRSEVEAIHNEAFAKATEFDAAKRVEGVDPAAWEKMSLQDKQAAHARQYQQMVVDRTSPEYIAEYSAKRPPQIGSEEWNQMSVAERQAAHTKATGKMTSDPAEMGRIYAEEKFSKPWREGTYSSQTEALEGLKKTGKAAQKTAEAAGRALDPQTMDALEIVERGGDPAMVDQAVRNLGVNGGVEGLANRLRSIIESKNLTPKAWK